MASIFDYSNYNMTPEEIKALEAEVSKQRPYIKPGNLPSTVNMGLDGLVGNYSEASPGPTNRTAGLLGSDPVSTQYGSRVNPKATSGVMYGGKGGKMSPDINAARTPPSANARWVPPGVASTIDAAKTGADWVPPAETRRVMGEVAGKGLLRTAGKFLGPLGLAYDITNPEMLGDGELSPEQREAKNPGETMDAAQYTGRVQENAARAAGKRPVSLLVPEEEMQMDAPQQSPMTPQAAQAAPDSVPAAAKTTAVQMEAQRQQVEQGAVKGLSTGAVSRPEFAEAIVQADTQKSGATLTPEAHKQAVAAELTNMKSMDNSEVSRYISYALAGAGLLAAVFDKSGRAGDNFSASFNKQLDRNLAGGLAQRKQDAAAAKQAQDLKIALAGLEIKQQVANTGDRRVDQQGEYQDSMVDQGQQKIGISQQGLGLRAAALNQDAAQFGTQQAFRQSESTRKQANADRDFEITKGLFDNTLRNTGLRATEIANKEAADRATRDAGKGIDITTKDAEDLVDATVTAQGNSVDKQAKASLAQTVRVAAKNNPKEFARDPSGFVRNVINAKKGPYTTEEAGMFQSGDGRVKQKKDTSMQ